jgi:hypothetical protein
MQMQIYNIKNIPATHPINIMVGSGQAYIWNIIFLHHALWYNYATQINEMHNFLNYLISVVFDIFQNLWVYPQEARCICSMVCFTYTV